MPSQSEKTVICLRIVLGIFYLKLEEPCCRTRAAQAQSFEAWLTQVYFHYFMSLGETYFLCQTLIHNKTDPANWPFFHMDYFFNAAAGADPGFFLGGGALVACSTSTHAINHIVFCFFCRIPVVLENRKSSQGGGVRTPCTLPLDPPLRENKWIWRRGRIPAGFGKLCIPLENPSHAPDFGSRVFLI